MCGLIVAGETQVCDGCGYDFASGVVMAKHKGWFHRNCLLVIFLFGLASLIGFNAFQFIKTTRERTSQTEQQAAAEKRKRDAEVRFNKMTLGQHLEIAELALKPGSNIEAIEDALRHVKAIPVSSPDGARAALLSPRLLRSQHLLLAQSLVNEAMKKADPAASMRDFLNASDHLEAVLNDFPRDAEASTLLDRIHALSKPKEQAMRRKVYVYDLQNTLREMGYDIVVWERGDSLFMDGDLFRKTGSRASFLEAVRRVRGLCEMGFRRIRLMQGKMLEVGTEYSLGCD